MSSRPEQPAGSTSKDEKRKSLTKLFSRARTVLRGESSRRKDRPAAEAPKPQPPTVSKDQEARMRYEAMQGVTRLSKSELFEERARKLGERFGLEIKAGEWQAAAPDEMVMRMDKPIRMRVRRTCHRCNTAFTTAKECPNCQHVRCTKCARYPPKRSEAEVIASRERRAAIIKANKENAPIVADYFHEDKPVQLKKPSKTGGQDLIYKKPRQRVRRTCHQCSTVFASGSKVCASCEHVRCTDCPRDPSKKDKYPLGYPGDEFGPNSIPHFECLKCKTIYPTNADNGTKCKKCGLEKTDDSPRAKPRKVEPEPDPEVVKSLEEKMKGLNVGT